MDTSPKVASMHSAPRQEEMRPCAHCTALFKSRVPWQEFCKAKCRTEYNKLRGVSGRIVTVRRLMKGRTSITLHFTGPAAEAALNLANGEYAYVAKASGSQQ